MLEDKAPYSNMTLDEIAQVSPLAIERIPWEKQDHSPNQRVRNSIAIEKARMAYGKDKIWKSELCVDFRAGNCKEGEFCTKRHCSQWHDMKPPTNRNKDRNCTPMANRSRGQRNSNPRNNRNNNGNREERRLKKFSSSQAEVNSPRRPSYSEVAVRKEISSRNDTKQQKQDENSTSAQITKLTSVVADLVKEKKTELTREGISEILKQLVTEKTNEERRNTSEVATAGNHQRTRQNSSRHFEGTWGGNEAWYEDDPYPNEWYYENGDAGYGDGRDFRTRNRYRGGHRGRGRGWSRGFYKNSGRFNRGRCNRQYRDDDGYW